MNHASFWRLVWKEYRLQRAFWLAMVVLTLLVQMLSLSLSEANRGSDDVVGPLFDFAVLFSALYALGCGATLFATERETGTYEFQRTVPVSWLRLFAAKATWAALSTLSILAVLILLAVCVSGWRLPDAASARDISGLLGFGAVELLLWGVFFSLVVDQPLVAAILAITTVSFYVHSLAFYVAAWHDRSAYWQALPWRIAIVAAVGVVDLWLARRWFRGGDKQLSILGARRGTEEPSESVASRPQEQPSRWVLFGHLLWQQWRHSRRMMIVLAVVTVPLLASGLWLSQIPFQIPAFRYGSMGLRAVTVAASLLAGLMGVCVFLGDQRREQFRFLAEHAARPGFVWLSRQLIWIVPVILLAALMLPFFLLTEVDEFGRQVASRYSRYSGPGSLDFRDVIMSLYTGRHAWELLVCVAMAYTAGQFCSMLFRSGILAAVFGLALGGVLCLWTFLMRSLYLNLFWTAAPIPVALLLATRLRTADWILHRNTVRAWLRPAGVIVVPAVAILFAVPLMRVHNIPLVEPILQAGEYQREPTAEEQATEAMYQQARDVFVPYRSLIPPKPLEEGLQAEEAKPDAKTVAAQEDAWVRANQAAIARLMTATRQPLGDVGCPPRPSYSPEPLPSYGQFAHLLLAAARLAQREANLDQAMECYLATLRLARYAGYYSRYQLLCFSYYYLHQSLSSIESIELSVYDGLRNWSALPGQRPERVTAVLKDLGELIPTFPSQSNALKVQYIVARDLIQLDPAAVQAVGLDPNDVFLMDLCDRWFSWERTRAQRFLDITTAGEIAYCQAMEDPRAGQRRFTSETWHENRARRHRGLPNPSFLPQHHVPELSWSAPEEILRLRTQRVVIRVVLGIQAWRVAHGRLPDSLDLLVRKKYLDPMPVDPLSNGPFRYLPEGLPFDVVPGRESFGGMMLPAIPAGTPLLASADVKVTPRPRPDSEGWEEWRRNYASSGGNAWFADRVFPLPRATAATAVEHKAATREVPKGTNDVPEGRLTITQRFIAGDADAAKIARPVGTVETGGTQ